LFFRFFPVFLYIENVIKYSRHDII